MPYSPAIPSVFLATLLAGALACQTRGGAGSATNAPTSSSSAVGIQPGGAPAVSAMSMEQAGEYLTIAGSCNDCHTQGWSESQGTVPSADRLAGLNLGFRGPWGTTYGKNLRTIVQRQSEDRWVQILKTSDDGDGKPPMPWWNTAQLSERDMRAMYRYIKSLGPKVNGVPRGLPAGREPTGPFIWVVAGH